MVEKSPSEAGKPDPVVDGHLSATEVALRL